MSAHVIRVQERIMHANPWFLLSCIFIFGFDFIEMRTLLAIAFGIYLATGTKVTRWETTVVLDVFRRDISASLDKVFSDVKKEASWMTKTQVETVITDIERNSRVPNWFHSTLTDYARMRGLDAIEPGLVNWIIDQSEPDPSFPVTDESEIARRAEIWMTVCVRPLAVLRQPVCIQERSGHWRLIQAQKIRLIDLTIMKNNEDMDAIIEREIRQNFLTNSKGLSERLHVNELRVKRIKLKILRIFVQPEWLLDELLMFPGSLAHDNPELQRVVTEKAEITKIPLRGENLEDILKVWVSLCAIPIRAGRIHPLPYIRQFPVSNGEIRELIVLRPELIQQYLAQSV